MGKKKYCKYCERKLSWFNFNKDICHECEEIKYYARQKKLAEERRKKRILIEEKIWRDVEEEENENKDKFSSSDTI